LRCHRALIVISFLLALSPYISGQVPTPPSTSAGKYVPGHVLVKFRPSIRPSVMRAAHLAVAGNVEQTFTSVEGLQLVSLPATTRVADALATYRANPNVQYAEPDFIVHRFQTANDPLFPSMWSLLNTGQSGGTPGADIKAAQAWNVTTGSRNVVVAVIDTGVDYNHPDLAANIFSGPICPGGIVCHGINTVQGSALGPNDPFDDNGHGTHVSGTIGALGNNAIGVTGINWNVTILPCKFLGFDGSGAISGAIQCLDFIKSVKDTQGLNIIASNNSWGGFDFSQALQDAIDRQRQSGILFIAAAGNDFANNDTRPVYPATFPLPNVISVAATDRNDARAFFSNLGSHTVHLGAPGRDILSTLPGATYGLDTGTSMATPHVTGVAALLAAQDPTRDWRQIKNLIVSGGDSNIGLVSTISGRRLNAFSSMTCLNSPVTARLTPTTDLISGSVGVPLALSAININCGVPNGPIKVTVSPGGQIINLTDDGVAPDLSAADGVYTGAFTPSATGIYSLAFSTGDTITVQVLNNYQASNTSFNYRNITGTNLNLGDDDVAQIASPFAIPFGNGSFTQLWVSSNGTISFSGAFSSYIHEFIPTNSPLSFIPISAPASTLVAPFWDDLLPLKGTPQNVFWAVSGAAPNRELVIEWRDVRAFECSTEADSIKFQVVFFENASDVLFNYADTVFGGSCLTHDRGNNGTIGLQVAPQLGTLWSIDGQSVTDGTAVLWQVPASAPAVPPAAIVTSISPAVVDAYGPDLTLTINGSNFVPGARAVVIGGFDRVTTFVSSTQLQALIPASDLDLFFKFSNQTFIGAHNPGAFADVSPNSPSLTINNPPNPVITSVTPAVASADGLGFIININGTNFTPFTSVTWNGQPLAFPSSFSRTLIQAVVPGSFVVGQGSAQLQVSNPAPGGGVSPIFVYPIGPATSAVIALPGHASLVQFPGIPGHPTTAAPLNAESRPMRFMGWNHAPKMSSQYMDHFVRPYGGQFTLSADKAAPTQTGGSTSALAVTSPLPGLALNDSTLTGFLPSSIATGDFNRDGHLDYVVSNAGSNDIWLYLGNGDGTFQNPRIIQLSGQSPIQIIAADLRGVGILDLILAEPDSISVGVLLGNGDGSFGAETLYFAPGPVFSIAVADFNGTGHLDVVAGILGDNRTGPLAFFAGDGTGKFSAPVFTPTSGAFAVPWATTQIAVADFDHDGLPDLLVTDEAQFSPGIIVYKNVGGGVFKHDVQLFFSGDFEFFLNAATGDMNHDGCPDVVAVDDLGLATIALGNCDGTFHAGPAPVQFGDGDVMPSVVLADINGDGNLDVVTSGAPLILAGAFGGQSGSLVSVAFGDGTGALAVPQLYRVQTNMFGLATGDFNGDLHTDIVVASQDTDSTTVLLNNGLGRFGGPNGGYIGWSQTGSPNPGVLNAPDAQFVADMNGDGKPDLLFADFGQQSGLPWNVSLALNDGTGHFAKDIKIPILDGAFQYGGLVTGDFRNTGRQDMLVIPSPFGPTLSGNFYNFIPNNGAGQFGRPITTGIAHLPGTMGVGDFNGDGKLDFVMITDSEVDTFLGNGDGTFTPGPVLPFVTGFPPIHIYAADVNGDGKLDLLVPILVGGASTLMEFLGHGDGSFAPGVAVVTGAFPGTGIAAPYLAVVDLNHDGHLDVVERNPGFFPPLTPLFKIYMGQPDGTFVLTNTYSPYSGTNEVTTITGQLQFESSFVADFNGDGNPDIASFQRDALSGSYVQIMLGNGDGTFTPTFEKFRLGQGNFIFPTLLADLDGDGKADFVELDGFTAAFNVIHSTVGHAFNIQFDALPVLGTGGTLSASLPVPAGQPTVLQLSSSDPGISIPASVTVPAGSLTASVPFTVASTFDRSSTFKISATDGVNTSSALASVAVPGASVGLIGALGNPLFRALLPGQSSGDLAFFLSSRGGYQTTASLTCENLPPGVTCQFGSSSVQVHAGGTANTSLILAVTAPVPIGNYTFNVVATDASIRQSTPALYQVGDFGLQLTASGNSALPTGFELISFDLTSINNFQGIVNFTCSGLPAGATCGSGGAQAGFPSGMVVNTSNVPVGNYPFVITGDTGFTTHSINAVLHVGDFSAASITPASATLSVGQSATFSLTASSTNGFSDPIQFFCGTTVNGQPVGGLGCSFSPATATFDATGKLTDQVTVTAITRPRSGVVSASVRIASVPWLPASIAILFFAGVVIGAGKRKGTIAVTCILMFSLSAIVACGGGGGSTNGGTPAPIPTPTPAQPVTVVVTVFGQSTAQSPAPPRPITTFRVTVQ
jgi:subtilisin family serine protease